MTTTHTDTSQSAEILAALQAGETLTQRDATRRFGCGRLGARIWELRREGLNIQREMVKVKKANGKQTSVARYFLA